MILISRSFKQVHQIELILVYKHGGVDHRKRVSNLPRKRIFARCTLDIHLLSPGHVHNIKRLVDVYFELPRYCVSLTELLLRA